MADKNDIFTMPKAVSVIDSLNVFDNKLFLKFPVVYIAL